MTELENSLIEKYFNDTCSDAEKIVVMEWFRSAEGQDYLSRQMDEDILLLMTNKEKHSTTQAPIKPGKNRESSKPIRRNRRTLAIAIASVAASLMLLFAIRQFSSQPVSEPVVFASVDVPAGESKRIVLEDSTVVWINSDTRILYPQKGFANQRTVYVEGEAYFQVAKNEASPFTVKLPCMDIQVLGTSFNVKAYKNDDVVTASLDEGVILAVDRVSSNGNTFRIMPGNNVEYSRATNHFSVYKTETRQASAWRDGRFVFKDTPLPEIAKILKRKYSVDFIFENSRVESLTYSIVIDATHTVEEILRELQIISPLRYERAGDMITLK